MFAPFTTRIVTGAPPCVDPLAGPGVDPLLRGERIGDVRLQGDAGLDFLEPRPVERPHEDVGRELLVAVLLHVEVDELRHDGAIARG